MDGSPSCNRITSLSFLAFLYNRSNISSLTNLAASNNFPFLENFKIDSGMREPEYTITSAF